MDHAFLSSASIRACSARDCSEHHRPPPVHDHAIVKMQRHGPCEHQLSLDVAPDALKLLCALAVVDADDVLVDDRPAFKATRPGGDCMSNQPASLHKRRGQERGKWPRRSRRPSAKSVQCRSLFERHHPERVKRIATLERDLSPNPKMGPPHCCAAGPISRWVALPRSHARLRTSSLSTACCYSWFLTASGLACFSVPSRITVLCPAAEGKPSALLTSGSITDEKDPPQPFTPGAANELSTSEL
jgi:hypothetical protein